VIKSAVAPALLSGSGLLLGFPALSQVLFSQLPAPAPVTNAREAAPIDLTGTWVSIVTESWRFRMVPPVVGDFQGVPITELAFKTAGEWDPQQDEAAGLACRSYGAAAIMRVPGRIRISWVDDNQLKVEIDAGTQTRFIHFGNTHDDAPAERTWQGYSVGEWVNVNPANGTLKVTTGNMLSGYLRKNGLPYSEDAVMTEYWNLHEISGEPWIVVTTEIVDPLYLSEPYYTSPNFRREPNDRKWNPTECDVLW
ncbi:MAG: hypothetical protein PVF50_07055, partial [Gammaproteobacteria bacterium]